ncbi:MAG: hypothetical protein ABJL73_07840, partial [Lentilitoribacter sp.]
MQSNLTKSFDSAQSTFQLLDGAEAAHVEVVNASPAYRPIHDEVRMIERDIRKLEEHKAEIETTLSRLPDGEERQAARIRAEIDEINAEVLELQSEIPDSWDATYEAYNALNKAETAERRKFYQASQAAYDPIVETISILQSTDAFNEVKDELFGLAAQIEANEPADMVDPLSEFAKKFDAIAGASDVKSGVSKARRALRSKTPDKEKALRELTKSLEEYEEQAVWRAQATASVLPGLETYHDAIKGNIGIRGQSKLTEEQALFVASCQSGHRDISLSF